MTTYLIGALNAGMTKTQELIETGCQSDNPFVRTGALAALFVATIFPGYPVPEPAESLPSTPDTDTDIDREVSGSMQLIDRVTEHRRRPPPFLAEIRQKDTTTEDRTPPPPPAHVPPPPPALAGLFKAAKKKEIVPVSEEEAQRMIEQNQKLTAEIQGRRVHIRGLEDSNKGVRNRISMVRGSIQTDTGRRKVYLASIENHERTLEGYQKLLAELQQNPTKQLQCREETQKSGVIVVTLDNAKAIEKLKGDIIKRSLDLRNEKEQVRALDLQVQQSHAELEVLLDTPVVGANITMAGFEQLLTELDVSLREVQARLTALNQKMRDHGVKAPGKKFGMDVQADIDPEEAKAKSAKEMEERLIAMRPQELGSLMIVEPD